MHKWVIIRLRPDGVTRWFEKRTDGDANNGLCRSFITSSPSIARLLFTDTTYEKCSSGPIRVEDPDDETIVWEFDGPHGHMFVFRAIFEVGGCVTHTTQDAVDDLQRRIIAIASGRAA